jgi:hypothetical protein
MSQSLSSWRDVYPGRRSVWLFDCYLRIGNFRMGIYLHYYSDCNQFRGLCRCMEMEKMGRVFILRPLPGWYPPRIGTWTGIFSRLDIVLFTRSRNPLLFTAARLEQNDLVSANQRLSISMTTTFVFEYPI